MTTKPEVRIEDWSVVGSGSPYTAPEARTKVLQGRVFGHPKIEDGHWAHTSEIVTFDLDNRRIETGSSMYLLGAIDPKYYAEMMNLTLESEKTKAALIKHWAND